MKMAASEIRFDRTDRKRAAPSTTHKLDISDFIEVGDNKGSSQERPSKVSPSGVITHYKNSELEVRQKALTGQ